MRVSFTHYVFTTLTYNREDYSSRRCRHLRWWWVSRDVTAFIQRVRRQFKPLGPVEFLRVIERHQDFEPHVHLLLHFKESLRVDNDRFFDRKFFSRLQGCWKFGFSKPEVLRHAGQPSFAFSYALKYFFKQITDNDHRDDAVDDASTGLGTQENEPRIWPLKGKRVSYFGMPIRLLAWSRGMQYHYQVAQQTALLRKGYKVELPSKLVLREISQHKGTVLTNSNVATERKSV